MSTVEIARGPVKVGSTYLATTDDAFVLVIAKGAFITNSNESSRPHVAVTDGTLAITFVAETANGNAGLLAAHYEIAAHK